MGLGSCVFLLVAALPSVALAYIGPGAGVTMLGALWGVLAAIVLTIGGLLYWPIRAALRRRRKAESPQAAAGESAPTQRAPEPPAQDG